ncbi:MAG: ABC-ATPase domain-containing protein [Gammaproteobacteria bacterium]|nr:ABC-ATPase domain-containing protein [Gammaproteobacteria bacterium]NIR84840.1 ABC-ATPase domain-containing protein [Gammaproteobacteria bacterium]NIR91554.1 ABC-ATPase domain-containing protein [Gammaproteobacteria bacterium]NIU05887.1 ABC-ATPase domain-containing protein [Gammaproteobacteria bacterium]NIV76742.1 ATPase [Gammaproteobacteria bacterium]
MQPELERKLSAIDGRGYKAYKSLQGRYAFDGFTLHIDHAQADPFGSPSRLRVRVARETARFPEETYANRSRAVALRDFLARAFGRTARQASRTRGTGGSGLIAVDTPGQEVLERTAVLVDGGGVEARFVAGLPAAGRRVLAREARAMLLDAIPALVRRSLVFASLDAAALRRHVETVEDADTLRGALAGRDLVAFAADGAILPRASGVDDRPLAEGALALRAPESLRVTLPRPNGPDITGLGIPRGVTLVVGGGYHGKSTLLQAIERGVYDHVPGDGREFVVADPGAVKIRAEDGRSIAAVDISPFIDNLPGGVSTTAFDTPNASGSTSQAANIMEALEAGARCLLMDEDTSATNFMIRDHRMQELIAKDHEPITPYIDKVRQLYDEHGVSTILVLGGSGDYLDKADSVIAMDHFQPHDVTERAHAVGRQYETRRIDEGGPRFGAVTRRRLAEAGVRIAGRGDRPPKIKVQDRHAVRLGDQSIDLAAIEQLVDESQTRAIAHALLQLNEDGEALEMPALLERVEAQLRRSGLDSLSASPRGDLAAFRRFELAAALNRLRTLRAQPASFG